MKSVTCTAFADQIASYNGNTTLLSNQSLQPHEFYGFTPINKTLWKLIQFIWKHSEIKLAS